MGRQEVEFLRGREKEPTRQSVLILSQSVLILRGERARKKRDFLVETYQRVPKNAFSGLFFFQKFACGAKNLINLGSL